MAKEGEREFYFSCVISRTVLRVKVSVCTLRKKMLRTLSIIGNYHIREFKNILLCIMIINRNEVYDKIFAAKIAELQRESI